MSAPPPTAPHAPPIPWRDLLAQGALVVLVVATFARQFWRADALLWLASAALIVYAAAVWSRVSRQARVFVVVAVCACVPVLLATEESGRVLRQGFAQSVQFATLLAALATLRLPMRRSALITRAAAWLVACPPRGRYTAITFGSHLLSLMFSFGVVPMMGEMLRRSGLDARRSATARHMLIGVIRGLALTTAWSPMAISFAIVSTALPSLQPLAFVATGMVAAALLLGADCVLHRPATATEAPAVAPGGGGDALALLIILGMATSLFLATFALYELSGWGFMMCAAAVLPCFSLLWLLAIRGGGAGVMPSRSSPAEFFAVLTETRSETFIFSASTFIGQAIVTLALAFAPAWMAGAGISPLWMALLCLWSIPLVAAVSIAPTILVLIWAQAIAHTGMGTATPLTFAMAMTLGWSLAICVSPVSATLLITGSITGIAPREIAMRWNLGFVAACTVAASLMLLTLYALGL